MKNLPVEVSDEDIEEMWSFADKNGDGKLSYKEFKAITQFSQSRKQLLFNCSTVSFSKVVLSQGAVNQLFLGVFLMFLAVFHSKIWAQFHFGTFKPYK